MFDAFLPMVFVGDFHQATTGTGFSRAAESRTLMLWSLHTMSVDNFPLQAGQPGAASRLLPKRQRGGITAWMGEISHGFFMGF